MSEMLRGAGPYISAVYLQAAAIFLFAGIGFFLDQWMESFPLYFMIGIGIGIIIGLYEMAKLILRDR